MEIIPYVYCHFILHIPIMIYSRKIVNAIPCPSFSKKLKY